MGDLDYALPGTLSRRFMRCGKANCRCKADPPVLHGPYLHWTRTVAGRTVTRTLTPDQAARYQAWSDNARRLRDIVTDVEARSRLQQGRGTRQQIAEITRPRSAERQPQDRDLRKLPRPGPNLPTNCGSPVWRARTPSSSRETPRPGLPLQDQDDHHHLLHRRKLPLPQIPTI